MSEQAAKLCYLEIGINMYVWFSYGTLPLLNMCMPPAEAIMNCDNPYNRLTMKPNKKLFPIVVEFYIERSLLKSQCYYLGSTHSEFKLW